MGLVITDIIGNVVDKMRYTGSFNSVTQNGNEWTINVRNKLVAKEWVEVDGSEYKVIEADTTYFKVQSASFPSSGTYKALAPYYLYGHRLEIANRLLEKDKDDVYKFQKYPLIALRLPIPERKNDGIVETRLNIGIMEFTEKRYNSAQRYENVFKPKLNPLYLRFMDALRKFSGALDPGIQRHTKVDRLFWGIEYNEGNSKYIFNDPIDAIEMVDLIMKFTDKKC